MPSAGRLLAGWSRLDPSPHVSSPVLGFLGQVCEGQQSTEGPLCSLLAPWALPPTPGSPGQCPFGMEAPADSSAWHGGWRNAGAGPSLQLPRGLSQGSHLGPGICMACRGQATVLDQLRAAFLYPWFPVSSVAGFGSAREGGVGDRDGDPSLFSELLVLWSARHR